ncbi:MAG TPA: OPT family oligopeptide transporter [Polyangiaceae bacterium]|nr:OPT family oligopeptide transporter [Polyangiaceae bacterium]
MSLENDRETRWLATVYRPGEAQLTGRAVLVGMLIGVVMCLSNLYVFFKTGWSIGVTITAAILAFTLFRALASLRLVRAPLSALENNALTTVASGAGYMTAGGNMAALGALLMATGARPPTLALVAWFGLIAALGVFAAIPIKRQLINQEGVAFPTGTATAETIRTLHAEGGGAEAAQQSRALMGAAGFAALLTWLREAKAWWMPFNVPGTLAPPITIATRRAAEWTLALKTEVVLIGVGGLMSFRTTWSLLLGGLLTYGVLAPSLVARNLITQVSYKAIVGWTVWPGAALLVSAGLTSFALDWRSVARSFGGLTRLARRGPAEGGEPIEQVECPAWWFPAGFAVLSPFIVVLMVWLFHIPFWACLFALPLAVVMAFIAARVTGETDVTPTKALGPVTQLIFGALTPGNLAGNIMAANVTGGIGLHAADLLTTLKTGWLLGGDPRAQFRGQLAGVVVGATVIVPALYLLIPDPSVLGSEQWPAPSCVVWEGVSRAFANGLGALDPSAKVAIAVGYALGTALALAERFAPAAAKPYVPSPSGLGLAMVIPGSNAVSIFAGGLAAELVRRRRPKFAASFVVPIASGFIAGESLMGVLVIVLKLAKVLAI